MTAVVIGVVFIFLGGWGLIHWFSDFLVVLRGFGPISVFLGGLVAVMSGIASFRGSSTDDQSKK